MKTWLVKQEPTAYSWDDFCREGSTLWTGIRNFQARNNLAAMAKGDRVLFYHSVTGKAVMGVAEVTGGARPDPTSDDPRWLCVELRPLFPLPHPVSLDKIKATPELAAVPLLRQSRLSVMPLTGREFDKILELGGAKAGPGSPSRRGR